MTPLLLVGAAAVLSAICLVFLSASILWVWIIWATCCLAAAYTGGSRLTRIVFFNFGALAAILAITEIVLGLSTEGERRQTIDPASFIVQEPQLGHRARANSRANARLMIGDEVVYDVVYTTGAHGLRISPPGDENSPAGCVLFFGDSFTFGEGLNDEQAMPYVAGVALRDRFRTRNFGFLGYGPHHMLAAIETGWVKEAAADCEPRYAVYWALLHHVIRAAGTWPWDDKGPRYVMQADGSVIRAGNFQPRDTLLADASKVSRLANRFRDSVSLDRQDVDLYFAIVGAARDRLAEMYPGIQFHALLWDTGHEPEAFLKGWGRAGIELHRVSRILPDWGNRDWLYQQPHDVHPNAAANDLLGRYLAKSLSD